MNIFEAMDQVEPSRIIQADTNIEIDTPKYIEEMRRNPPFLSRTLATIDDVDEYGQNRGAMGLDFGFTHLNNAFNGLNPGLTLVAGPANSGKSMLLLEMMRRIIKENQYISEDHPKKAYCLYFSLDDSNNELMPRMVASDQMIRINEALFPKTLKDKPIIEAKRAEGFKRLKESAAYFSMFDAENGQDIHKIESTIDAIYQELELVFPGEYQPVIFIDNFHDIDYQREGGFTEDNAKFDYVSNRLNEIAIKYDAPVVCSAEFRKINTLKRPQLDDIKSTGKITYEAKAIILVFNEVGVQDQDADVYWVKQGNSDMVKDEKMPVLEMHVAKNKFSSYKGREFLRFWPEFASFTEPGDEEAQDYRAAMRG